MAVSLSALGPYRVVSFDPAKGEVVYERYDAYAMKDVREAGHIKKIVLSSIPDQQTQIAKLSVRRTRHRVWRGAGRYSLAARQSNLAIRRADSVFHVYSVRCQGPQWHRLVQGQGVREALLMAIDRPGLVKAFVPQEHWDDKLQQSMCYEWHIGCASSLDPVKFDPVAAKKFLTGAGYPTALILRSRHGARRAAFRPWPSNCARSE